MRSASHAAGVPSMARTAAHTARALAAVLVLLAAHANTAKGQPGVMGEFDVVVSAQRLTVLLPPLELPPRGGARVSSRFAWIMQMRGRDPFSIVIAPDSAMREDRLEHILAASRIRLCEGAAIPDLTRCSAPLGGRLFRKSEYPAAEITDRAVITRMRTAMPEAYQRYVFEAGGRFRSERFLIWYTR